MDIPEDYEERGRFITSPDNMLVTGGAGTAKTTECLRKAQANPHLHFLWLTFANAAAYETATRAAQMGLTNFFASTCHGTARRLLYENRKVDHAEPATLADIEVYKARLSADVTERLYERRNEINRNFPDVSPCGNSLTLDERVWVSDIQGPNLNNMADDLVEIVYERYDLQSIFKKSTIEMRNCGQGLIVDILEFIRSAIVDDVVSGRHYSFDWSVRCVIELGLHELLCRKACPERGFDCLMFDEAQDLSVDLFEMMPSSKHIQKIFLGESAQSIYTFRVDCFNVFKHDSVESFQTIHFRQSYRCSREVIEYAQDVCKDTDLDIDMVGNPNFHTSIYKAPNEYALEPGLLYVFLGREWLHCFGFLTRMDQASALPNNFKFRFLGYDSASDALACLDEKIPEPTDYKNKIAQWITDDDRYASSTGYDLALGTVHSAKGLTIPNVILSDVVINNVSRDGGSTDSDDPGLAYVAITRAVERLILSSSVRKLTRTTE